MASFRRVGERIECVQADVCIEISDDLLAAADEKFVSREDDTVTFHCANGDICYRLVSFDDILGVWTAVRCEYEEAA